MRTTEGGSMNDGIHLALREARRRKGLTQSQVADAIECKQSAISMLENGRRDALSRDKLSALAKLLDVDLSKSGAAPETAGLAYCPDPACPSNIPYVLRGQVVFHPTLVAVRRETPAHCALCGEVLETRCPNAECRSAPQPGAFCGRCGSPYVCAGAGEPEQSADDAQRRIRSLLELTAAWTARLSTKETPTP
jgi:transcriptional regulator with XRE-family HTH domain